jgi:hypothetical protein
VHSAPASIRLTCSSIVAAERFASSEALAFTLVPFSTTRPRRISPASRHIRSTVANTAAGLSMCRRREHAITVWSGTGSQTMEQWPASRGHRRSIARRDVTRGHGHGATRPAASKA